MKADPSRPRFPAGSDSLIKKHLSQDLFQTLSRIRTDSGFTLKKAIRSGVANPDSSIGIYIGDTQSYVSFAPVLTPIIRDYHNIDSPIEHQNEFTKVNLPNPDPDGKYIRSTRIRVARNLESFPFCCHIQAHDRVELESRVICALDRLPEDLSGEYIPFTDLAEDIYEDLVQKKLAFPKGDRFQEAAGLNRDFPLARGVFLSRDKGFRVWVNEEDHLRIMALESGPDLSAVFNRLCRGLGALGPHLEFAFDSRLGFLSSCPTNIGTAMRAGVHICLKKLEQRQDVLKAIVARHHLQIRGTCGEKTAVDQGVFDISNARRLGVSANQIVQDLHTGLLAIIETEKNL